MREVRMGQSGTSKNDRAICQGQCVGARIMVVSRPVVLRADVAGLNTSSTVLPCHFVHVQCEDNTYWLLSPFTHTHTNTNTRALGYWMRFQMDLSSRKSHAVVLVQCLTGNSISQPAAESVSPVCKLCPASTLRHLSWHNQFDHMILSRLSKLTVTWPMITGHMTLLHNSLNHMTSSHDPPNRLSSRITFRPRMPTITTTSSCTPGRDAVCKSCDNYIILM